MSALFPPHVFERWSAVESDDICQEPPADVDSRSAPVPYTQIEYTRAQSDAVDWESFALADLIGDSQGAAGPGLVINPVISEHADYTAAQAQADGVAS